jgi:hypothetical protein
MTASTTSKRAGFYVECAFVVIIIASVFYSYNYLMVEGQLPIPFYHGNDTFMDWINTAYWANNPGAYFDFLSVYPPISFVFLHLLTPHYCYRFDNLYNRECDWMFKWAMGFFFSLNAILVYKCYRLHDRGTAWLRTAAMCLGLPMLFAVERGQLAVPCFTFFVLAHGRLLRSARWRWLSMGLAINFKPYLLFTIVPQLLRRRWIALEGCVLAGLAVYLLSYAMLGVGTPFEIIHNMFGFNDLPNDVRFDNVYYQSTYKAITNVLATNIPFMHFVGSTAIDGLANGLPIVIRLGQFGVLLCFAGALWRPFAIPIYRLTALGVSIVITSVISGGYSQIFFLFLVLFEPWRGPARITALLATYILSVSWDFQFMSIAHQFILSYLTSRYIGFDLGVTVGELVRPGLLLLIEYALIAASLSDLFRARGRKPVGERLSHVHAAEGA